MSGRPAAIDQAILDSDTSEKKNTPTSHRVSYLVFTQ